MEEGRKTPYALQIVDVKIGDSEKARVYAVVCQWEAQRITIESEIRDQRQIYSSSGMSFKYKMDSFKLIDDKILEAGGKRLYLIKMSIYAECLNGEYKDLYRYQLVKAETALQAKQASSKSMWLRKDHKDWTIEKAILIEDVYDIIHIGKIKQGL